MREERPSVFAQDALEFRPYRRRDGEDRTECGWKESSEIKSRRRRRRKVEALNSMQIVSFLLFIGGKMRRRREAMRIENLLVALTFKKDARTTIGGSRKVVRM